MGALELPAATRYMLAWVAATLPTHVPTELRRTEILHALATLAAVPGGTGVLAETLHTLLPEQITHNAQGVLEAIETHALPIALDVVGSVSARDTRWRWVERDAYF